MTDQEIELCLDGDVMAVHALVEEYKALRAELDALRQQEPVLWVSTSGFTLNTKAIEFTKGCVELTDVDVPLYAAPTPPSVPSAKQLSDHKSAAYVLGWNECRAAMIQATPKPGEQT